MLKRRNNSLRFFTGRRYREDRLWLLVLSPFAVIVCGCLIWWFSDALDSRPHVQSIKAPAEPTIFSQLTER